MRILVVEDDAATAEFVAGGLADHGHEVELAADGVDGLARGVVTRLRAAGSEVPAPFLSTLAGIDDRVPGLEAGGDDYLVKPFALPELRARVDALARRARDATVDAARGRRARDRPHRPGRARAGRDPGLIPREFQLLVYLMRHTGRPVTRRMLLEHVWGFPFDPRTSVVETHVSRLRAKLDRAGSGDLVRTVRVGATLLPAPA